MKKTILLVVLALFVSLFIMGCNRNPSADQQETAKQEPIQRELTAKVGMPNITNGTQKALAKLIAEMLDKPHLSTWTYIKSYDGQLVLLGRSIGYGLPYATQYTSPMKLEWRDNHGWFPMPQADPNGLFPPASAEGTWILLVNPNDDKDIKPVYVEERVIVSQFPLASVQFTEQKTAEPKKHRSR